MKLIKVKAIDCYVCTTTNNSLKECSDPFSTKNPINFLQKDCKSGRKNRSGLFPATSCIKISGVYDTTKIKLVIRSCALDSGSLTQDTELVRNSHCGIFRFDEQRMRGCISTCKEDGCNSARSTVVFSSPFIMAISIYIFSTCFF
ncbi:unnamed protein product [Gordionus sp. m RMFG-2023]